MFLLLVPENDFNPDHWEEDMKRYNIELIMFVVDSTNKSKVLEAANLLQRFLVDKRTPKVPVLILANKQVVINKLHCSILQYASNYVFCILSVKFMLLNRIVLKQ